MELAQRGEVVSHVEQTVEAEEKKSKMISLWSSAWMIVHTVTTIVIACWGTTVLRFRYIFIATYRLLQAASLVVGLGKSAVRRVSTSFSSTYEFAGYGYFSDFSGYSHVQLGKILALGDALRILLLQVAEEGFAA